MAGIHSVDNRTGSSDGAVELTAMAAAAIYKLDIMGGAPLGWFEANWPSDENLSSIIA
jgi:hypothetical protein